MAIFKKKLKKPKAVPEKQEREMGFLDHLDELRARIIWGIVGLVIGCVISAVFIDQLMNFILLKPALAAGLKLQNLKPFGQPMLYFKVILIAGFILSFPFLLYQLWRFIAPGLYANEKSWARVITFYTTLCFMTGISFAYFLLVPSMMNFASYFGSSHIVNNIDVNEYLSFVSMTVLAAGLLFEMPMVVFVLSRFGMLTPKTMRKFRRHAAVLILVLSAIITPTPDPVNQLIFALPLFVLYEISILISKFALKKRQESING